jgi:hypothetical protein
MCDMWEWWAWSHIPREQMHQVSSFKVQNHGEICQATFNSGESFILFIYLLSTKPWVTLIYCLFILCFH